MFNSTSINKGRTSPKDKKILIVEDNELSRLYYGSVLEELQIPFVVCETFAAAEKEALSQNYDLILSDVKLGDGNGIDLLRAFDDENTRSTPFVIASGFTENELYDQHGWFNASAILTKPVSAADLKQLICKLLHISELDGRETSSQIPTETEYDHSLLFEVYKGNREEILKSSLDFIAYLTDAIKCVEAALVDGNFENLRNAFHRLINLANYFGALDLYNMIRQFGTTSDLSEKKSLLLNIQTELDKLYIFYSKQDFAIVKF